LLTLIFQTVVALAKSTKRLAHEITLLLAEVYIFRVANKTFSKRRRAKKTRVRQGSAFTIGDRQDILIQKNVDK
jgi:hypothetical protein